MRAVRYGVMFLWLVIWVWSGPCSVSLAETGVQITDKEVIDKGQVLTGQPNQKKTAGKEATEIMESESAAVSSSTNEKKVEKPAPKEGGKDSVTGPKKSSKADTGLKKTIPTAEDDRPWLMKEGSNKKPDIPPKKPAPLKWKDEAQQLQCKTRLKELQKALDMARTYSTRGDTCATAKHANDFLVVSDRLKTGCPEGFLERNGYSEKIVQNLKVLLELGKKACLEK